MYHRGTGQSLEQTLLGHHPGRFECRRHERYTRLPDERQHTGGTSARGCSLPPRQADGREPIINFAILGFGILSLQLPFPAATMPPLHCENRKGARGMPKLGEINYLKSAGADGIDHARNKPFSDSSCGRYLGDLGLVMALLPSPPARILDLGVGSGWTTAFLARRGYEMVGRDICPDMIALADENLDKTCVESPRFEVGDYESMAYRDEFDAVLFHDSLHHAENEHAALSATYDALQPGGICVTVEPGEGHAKVSRAAAKQFGVTEKDMPPHHIIAIGRALGFRQFRVYARSSEPVLLAFAGREGSLELAGRLNRWQCALGFGRKAIRALLAGSRQGDSEFLQRSPAALALRSGNIVCMEK